MNKLKCFIWVLWVRQIKLYRSQRSSHRIPLPGLFFFSLVSLKLVQSRQILCPALLGYISVFYSVRCVPSCKPIDEIKLIIFKLKIWNIYTKFDNFLLTKIYHIAINSTTCPSYVHLKNNQSFHFCNFLL